MIRVKMPKIIADRIKKRLEEERRWFEADVRRVLKKPSDVRELLWRTGRYPHIYAKGVAYYIERLGLPSEVKKELLKRLKK